MHSPSIIMTHNNNPNTHRHHHDNSSISSSTTKTLVDDEIIQKPTTTTAFIPKKRLTEQTMSQNLRTMEYAVRGKVVIAADRINQELEQTETKSSSSSSSKQYPFDHIVYTNIGNPHGVGQLPLTWPRQVMALCDLPDKDGVDNQHVKKMFPIDAIDRAREIKKALGGHGTGAYTHSQGPFLFRKEICDFIEERDGFRNEGDDGSFTDPECIFMTNGASSGIEMILNALIADKTWYVHVVEFCYMRGRRKQYVLGGRMIFVVVLMHSLIHFILFLFYILKPIYMYIHLYIIQWSNDPNTTISNL